MGNIHQMSIIFTRIDGLGVCTVMELGFHDIRKFYAEKHGSFKDFRKRVIDELSEEESNVKVAPSSKD